MKNTKKTREEERTTVPGCGKRGRMPLRGLLSLPKRKTWRGARKNDFGKAGKKNFTNPYGGERQKLKSRVQLESLVMPLQMRGRKYFIKRQTKIRG